LIYVQKKKNKGKCGSVFVSAAVGKIT